MQCTVPGGCKPLAGVRVEEAHDLAGDEDQRHHAEDEAARPVHDHGRQTHHRACSSHYHITYSETHVVSSASLVDFRILETSGRATSISVSFCFGAFMHIILVAGN